MKRCFSQRLRASGFLLGTLRRQHAYPFTLPARLPACSSRFRHSYSKDILKDLSDKKTIKGRILATSASYSTDTDFECALELLERQKKKAGSMILTSSDLQDSVKALRPQYDTMMAARSKDAEEAQLVKNWKRLEPDLMYGSDSLGNPWTHVFIYKSILIDAASDTFPEDKRKIMLAVAESFRKYANTGILPSGPNEVSKWWNENAKSYYWNAKMEMINAHIQSWWYRNIPSIPYIRFEWTLYYFVSLGVAFAIFAILKAGYREITSGYQRNKERGKTRQTSTSD